MVGSLMPQTLHIDLVFLYLLIVINFKVLLNSRIHLTAFKDKLISVSLCKRYRICGLFGGDFNLPVW